LEQSSDDQKSVFLNVLEKIPENSQRKCWYYALLGLLADVRKK